MDFNKILQNENGVLKVKQFIEDKYGGRITSNEAVRILYQLCSLLTKNERNYEANSLLDLIVLCCDNIVNLKDAEVNPFLMSVYHFIKYFFKHKMLDQVSILLKEIEKHCLDLDIKSDMYCYYVQVLTREIFANSREHTTAMLQQTILFSIKCEQLLIKNDAKAFSGRLMSYPFLFRHSHITNPERNEFCLNFIRALRRIILEPDIIIDIYKSYLNIFYITVSSISNCNTVPNFVQKTIEEILTIMYDTFKGKKYNNCIEILSLVFQSIIQDPNTFKNNKNGSKLQQCNQKLRQIILTYKNDPIVGVTCSQIGKTLKILVEYFERVRQTWTTNFPFNEIFVLFELIENVVSENTYDVERCCTKCNCKLQTDVFNAVSSSAISVEFANTIIRHQNNCLPEETHQTIIRIIQKCCKTIISLQQNGCDKYAAFWKFLGLHTYNTAVALYKIKNYSVSKLYTGIFVRNLISIEGTPKTNICFKDALGAALHLHSTVCQNLQEKWEAMLYSCLTMLYSKEYRKKAMWTWVVVKSDQQSDDEIKAITANDVLLQPDVKELVPHFKYDQKIAEELLVFELHYYSENWLSRIPIINTCKQLLTISGDIFIKTKALLLSYDKFLVMFDSRIISEVEATIDLINSKPFNFSYNICLSLLKFILYQFKYHEMVLKNLEDMNKAYIPLKSVPLQPFEEPPNPNDKCDIVPAFINLNFESSLKLYEHLDDCIKLWSTILDKKLTDPELLLLRDYKVLKIIKTTAFELRLHHFQVQMINTWILYYKLAEILDDKLAILEGIGFILEYGDCKAKEMLDLAKNAEDVIKSLDRRNQEHMCALTTFYVNKSAGCFNNGLVVEAYEHYCTAEVCFELCVCEGNICEARLLHLRTQFLLIPCTYEILDHQDNVLIIAQAAYTCIAEIYKLNSLKCAYTTSILFEISLSNGWIYKYLRLPREVRSYSKESVILAQKCLLPMRTAQFLSLLAFTDLLDRQYMDCEVKLSGLLKILCAPNPPESDNPPISSQTPSNNENPKTEINCDVPPENNNFFQTVLHVPTPEPQRITSSELGSPNLRKKQFVCPEFVAHAHTCHCYICRNYEYQKLIFDAVHLEALINFYQGDRKQAECFFNGGILLHKKLQMKIQSSNPIIILKTSKFIFSRVCKNISINYCAFLLNYAYFMMQKCDFHNASKILDNITLNNDHLKYTNNLFWTEVVLQKTNILLQKERQLILTEVKEEIIEPDLLVVVNTIVSTTPENKVSKNPIAVCISPGIKSKLNKNVKKIQFDLSDSDSDQENKIKSPNTNTNDNYFKLKTPGKTPAPKIKIYTPKTVKQPKRTNKLSAVPSLEKKIQTKVVVKKTLEERTKLLTEKLKASQKTPNTESKSTSKSKSKKDDIKNLTESIEKLGISEKEPARKKYIRIKQPKFSSSSLSSIDSPDHNSPRNKKVVLGSRIKKVNNSSAQGSATASASSSSDCVTTTRKSSRTRK